MYIEKEAVKILARRSRTSGELCDALLKKGFSKESISPVLEKYRHLGYLNDEEEAYRSIEKWEKKGYGPQWILYQLKGRKIALTEALLKKIKEGEKKSLAVFLAKKKIKSSFKEQRGLIAAAVRRGFDVESAWQIFEENRGDEYRHCGDEC